MARKSTRRENVEVRFYLDGKFICSTTKKNRHIFVNKNGEEFITTYGRVFRDSAGNLYAESKAVTIEPVCFDEILEVN